MLMTRKFVPVTIDLSPDRTTEAWQKDIEHWRTEHGAKTMLSMLSSVLPAALARVVLDLADIPPDTKVSRLSREQNCRLRLLIKNLPLTISGTEGFSKAMVTRGGIALDEVHPRTLESKLVRGLFFAGEILDVDGPCGGFNLQWAFSSGRLAALSAVGGLPAYARAPARELGQGAACGMKRAAENRRSDAKVS
jgi:predicted Rossmann fold flavoprotein